MHRIGDPFPDLLPDGRYHDAWVFLKIEGTPCGMVEIDLTSGTDAIRDRIGQSVKRFEVANGTVPAQPRYADEQMPRVSVVVPTIVKRIEELGRCIDSLQRLDYPDYEVIVVDNRDSIPDHDPLPGLIRDLPMFRSIREARPGASAARNTGVRDASGRIVAFTDDDVEVDGAWLRAIGNRMVADPGLAVVSGLILPAELETPAQIWFERYYGGFGAERSFIPLTLARDESVNSLLRGSQVIIRETSERLVWRASVYGIGAFVAGANMAFRKSNLDQLGGFDETLGIGTPSQGGEDLEMIVRILWSGGRVGYEPGAFVRHAHRREIEQLQSQLHGYGTGYTAMLTALILKDRRHVLGILSQSIPAALRRISLATRQVKGRRTFDDWAKLQSSQLPPRLIAVEVMGYCKGPLAYWRSRQASRRAIKVPSR